MNEKGEDKEKVGRIAYLLEDFLTPTTTFITQEVQYLHDYGCDMQVYITGSPIKEVDPAVADLLKIARFSRPVNIREILSSHITALLKFPTRYARTLWKIFLATWTKPAYCIRSIRYFIEGVHLGNKMVDRKIAWVHAHFAGRAATAAWSIWSIYGIPYSVTTHAYDLFADFNNPPANKRPPRIFSKRNLGSLLSLKLEEAKVIMTISEFNLRYLTKELKIAGEKIQILRCGVDVSRFQRQTKPTNDRTVILSVGGLVEKKGHEILLRACAYLKGWGYRFCCNIVGEGPLLPHLLALRKSLRLEDDVHLCGRVHHSELRKYHEEAEVFVLACVKGEDGNMDGIPVALMEAMAMEVPVVTTNLSGIPELVDSGVTGFLVEPGDPKELAEEIRQLLDNRQLRQNMGKLGREKVLGGYNQKKNLSLMASILFREVERTSVKLLFRPETARVTGGNATNAKAQ